MKMKYTELYIKGVFEIEPVRYGDHRGYFCETFKLDEFNTWTYKQLVRWLLGDPTMEAQSPTQPRVKVRGVLTKGIYLAGRTGTGKSTALTLLAAISTAFTLMS